MSSGALPKETLPLAPEQKQTVAQVATGATAVAALLLLFGLIQIAGGPIAWWSYDAGLFNALLLLIQGALTAFLGLVMLATASDFRFLGEQTRYGGNHLRNAANNLAAFHQAQLGLAVLWALVFAIRLLA